MYEHHNIALFDPRSGEDRKDKRGEEGKRGEKGGRGHCGNKVNLMVGENSGFEVSVYHHIINRCY